jgi:hypothetical protein
MNDTRTGRTFLQADRGLQVVAALIVVGLLALGARWILKSVDDGASSNGASGAGAAVAEDVPAGHVHAVVVDPEDASVLVAAHGGLFRVVNEDLDRVGESYRDVMGLSVGRDGDLLASGHPDVAGMQAGEPGQLGLIRSSDGGVTWSKVSLGGAADLHHIAQIDSGVLAWNAATSELIASDDLVDWEVRSTMPVEALAADSSGESLLAVSAGQLLRSVDGGRTFAEEQIDGDVTVLVWPDRGAPIAVTADGRVLQDRDAGWGEVGRAPTGSIAGAAAGGDLYLARDDGRQVEVHGSSDGGASWVLLARS